MKAEKLIELICHPEDIKNDSLTELENLVSSYPYFQAARTLFLKALYSTAKVRFRNELKTNTIYISDHKQLYKYLHNLLEFDHLKTVSREKDEFLSDIVTDRLQELNGYIPVNSFGVPAHKTEKKIPDQHTAEPTIEVNFQSSAPRPTPVPPVFTPHPAPDNAEVVSNPINLDGIPGVVNDYSDAESQKAPAPSPVYEVIERKSSQPYFIEPVNPAPETPSFGGEEAPYNESYHITAEKNTPPTIELKENQPTATPEAQEEKIHTDELSKLAGSYQLEGVEEEETTDLNQLATSIKKKKKAPTASSVNSEKNNKNDLIEKFIIEEPTIPRGNLDQIDDRDLSEESSIEKEDLFSETLAKIYIKQKLYEKAITTYIKLSLKYPEKSVYFAHRIEKIKEKINNNK